MTKKTINEGGLNDNILYIADENKIFKGGYKAIFEYWTFLNAWTNEKNIRSFRTLENAYKFINKNFNY